VTTVQYLQHKNILKTLPTHCQFEEYLAR